MLIMQKVPAPPSKIDIPAPFDILCGKDKSFLSHHGNRVFRDMIHTFRDVYARAKSKPEKMKLTKIIVRQLQETYHTRFLKFCPDNGGTWEEISNQAARDKVSHALRHACRSSSTSLSLIDSASKISMKCESSETQPLQFFTFRSSSLLTKASAFKRRSSATQAAAQALSAFDAAVFADVQRSVALKSTAQLDNCLIQSSVPFLNCQEVNALMNEPLPCDDESHARLTSPESISRSESFLFSIDSFGEGGNQTIVFQPSPKPIKKDVDGPRQDDQWNFDSTKLFFNSKGF